MAWFKGQATDYHDFLTILEALAKDDHVSAASVYDGGTGYAVGDTITLSGGTKSHEPEVQVMGTSDGDYITVAAVNAGGTGYSIGDSLVPATGTYIVAPVLEVLTLSGSAVATILIKNPGIASAQPTNPVATTTDGGGNGCTIDFTFAAGTGIVTDIHMSDAGVYTSQATNPVSQNTTSGSGTGFKVDLSYTDTAWTAKVNYVAQEASAAAISVAGTGYTANDIVTVVGGTFTAATTVKILTVSGGVPLTIEVHTEAGEYSTTPSNPASTSGGTGSGLTLTMTWANTTDERKYLMLQNTNSDQYVGWKAIKETVPETAYLLQNAGFTGFNSTSTPWDQQPGASVALAANDGTYTPLSGGGSPATVNYWISIQDQRIACVCRVASIYPNFYVGGIDKYLTANEYAYPQYIAGCLAEKRPYNFSGFAYGGMNNPGSQAAGSSVYPGPAWLRRPDGSFRQVLNWDVSTSPVVVDLLVNITPHGGQRYTGQGAPNNWWLTSYNNWKYLFDITTTISPSQYELLRVNGEFVLVPCTLVERDQISRIYGDLIGVYSINPNASVVPEDQIFIDNDVYRVFQNCNKTNRNYFFVMKED